MTAGETFLLPGLDDHLWMVLSDPAREPNLVVVFFLSWQPQYDQACVLQAGDHPFIKHSTCVNYPGARVVADAKLEAMKSEWRPPNERPSLGRRAHPDPPVRGKR